MSQLHLRFSVFKLRGPARGRLQRRHVSRKLEPDPRVLNGRFNTGRRSGGKDPLPAQINRAEEQNSCTRAGAACCGDRCGSVTQPAAGSEGGKPALRLHGARTEPSALLKVEGCVRGADGTDIPVHPMVDSGASGMGFVDSAFAQRCGAKLMASSRRITLADGSEVRAEGEVTLSYSLVARSCSGKDKTPPVRFTSTFIVTPLAPYSIILGVGWLEHHHALIGFRERSIQLRIDGTGKQHCIRPLSRCNDDGSEAGEAAPLQLKAITQKRVCKLIRQGKVEQLYAVLIRSADGEADAEVKGEAPVPGSNHPLILPLLAEFKSTVFGEPAPGVPRRRGVEHAIQLLPGAMAPPARPLRHQSEKDAAVMKEYVEIGLKNGTLHASTSPFGSMALIVKKKDGTPRVVIDYRALNEVTVKNKYPLPLMDELFDRTAGAKFFTSIDLRNGFHQIAIRPEDREKTAFRTRTGHFEYTVLPMGLCNAPGTFMQLMNQTFSDMLDQSVLCFLDDILIFSKTEAEHVQHVREVLSRLRKQELYVKMSKCAFMQREVAFLGHRIGADGLRVAPDKIGAVQAWPTPTSVSDVRSFLGLANFYRRFVKDYSRIALPLTELTKETNAWAWSTPQQQSFDALKAALCSPDVLLVPDQSKPFVLNCDACDYAIGATLQQDHGRGLQPVAFFSAKMSGAERNYDVREKEFMALLKACLHWRHYLHGTQPFTLLTDHDSLKYHKTMPKMSGRLARWIELMAEFDYKLQHIPGKDNIVADALSRRADYKVSHSINAARVVRMRAPESPTQRQRNIDAAMKVQPSIADAPLPNKGGTVMTPTQRCSANTKGGEQCAQRTAVAHLCWNHLRRDMGVRVTQSSVPGAGRGLFAAWHDGLPKGHRIPYTGDEIALRSDEDGGPYVLEMKRGSGIDAARRNCGLGRWVNDPRGARDAAGRRKEANCEFVVHTPRGARQRVGAVRTLRPIVRGEELLVRYGEEYWSFHPAARCKQQRKRVQQQRGVGAEATVSQRKAVASALAALEHVRSGEHIEVAEQVMAVASRRSKRDAAALLNAPPDDVPARAGRSAMTSPAAGTVADVHQDAPQKDEAELDERAVVDDAQRPERLMQAARRAAKGDAEYMRLLQAPGTDMSAENGLLFHRWRMCVPADAALRTRILSELHDSPTGGHCGRDRMLAEVQQRFEWKGMARDVEQYVLTCDACQRNKHSKQLKPGLLMPLPLPDEPCMHWTTDAVSGLPRSKRGFDAIQVYVCRRTKLKRFAVAHTTDTSADLASNTLRTIIGPHGMPMSIVSDRDPRITAHYWRELSRVLGSEINLSTAHHPQSDGQSEREIQTLITALRGYVNAMGNDWDEYLPALELAFNSKVQASTGASPFSLVYGVDARLPIDCLLDDVRPSTVVAAGQRADRMRKALDQARTTTEKAQARQKRLADRHRRLLELHEGDMVLLATEGLQLRSGTHKLTARYIGPFRVQGAINGNAVTLELPPLLGALHSTFNISRLKLYRDGQSAFPSRPQRYTQPPAVEADTNGVPRYEVECVLAQRGIGARRELLVRWKGYGAEDDEWQPRAELVRTAPVVVAEYDALQQGGSSRAHIAALSQLMTHSAA